MFKKSRIRIVAAIMSVLTLLWVGTLCVIYISSYFEVLSTNKKMLREQAELYMLEKHMSGDFEPMKPFPNRAPHIDTNRFKLSTFYSVAISYDDSVIEIKNDDANIFTDSELENTARRVLKRSKSSGVIDKLVYYKMDKGGYILVSFMDNTIIRESMNTLFRYTLIFGGVAIAILYFLAVYLAKRIVNPLEESYYKQKQFISDAGHELKTPVSVVSANAELLSREIGDNQWLLNIQYENERMGMLVCQLLDLARSENVTPQMEHIDYSRLVAGEALPFESVAFEKGLLFKSDVASGISVEGNSTQLKQIVSILLDNAIRHSKEQGEVCLSLTREHNFAKLSVINQGDEIPVEEREKIFERFYRMDTARNGEDKHYGLGLSIAKAIATSHKGHIEVHCFDGFVEFRVKIPTL